MTRYWSNKMLTDIQELTIVSLIIEEGELKEFNNLKQLKSHK